VVAYLSSNRSSGLDPIGRLVISNLAFLRLLLNLRKETWGKAVVLYVKVLLQNFRGETERSHNNQLPGLESKSEPYECRVGMGISIY
jgi:hypothetical protein